MVLAQRLTGISRLQELVLSADCGFRFYSIKTVN
jgi:hypothetical protein